MEVMINPVTNETMFRALYLPLIKVRFASKGCSLVKSGNTEQGLA
jgi:hypothetical protein